MTKVIRKEEGLLALSRVFAASQECVFDAWLNPEKIIRWFGCSQTKESKALEWNAQPGGRSVLEMQGCQDAAEAATGQLILEFQEIQPHSKLVFMMEFKSG
ncbi:MAG: SRPBCC domain-containing protein, partial [Gammaproteobacteria bacterium]|nr:SRPBCC domain-containing protein [Gammaproteobacteria bacterium]